MSLVFAGSGHKYLSSAISLATGSSTPFSFVVWTKLASLTNPRWFSAYYSTYAPRVMALGSGIGEGAIAIHSGGGIDYAVSDALTTGSWFCVVGRYDPAVPTAKAKVSGGTEATNGSIPVWSNVGLETLELGAYSPEGGSLDGKIAHLALFHNYYLTDGDVTAALAGDSPMTLGSTPTHYWPARTSADTLASWAGTSALTLAQTGTGTDVAWDGGDNPTVDDPPSGVEEALNGSALTGGHGTASPVFAIGL